MTSPSPAVRSWPLSRRTFTLLLGGLLVVALAVGAAVSSVPYVALTPGPAFNTLGAVNSAQVLTISGAPTYQTDGRLNLTTVDVSSGKSLTLAAALKGWLDPNEEIVPTEIIYPPDQTTAQTNQMNQQDMTQSQDDATTAALAQLGLGTVRVDVASVPTGPSTGKLMAGDVLTSVDGTAITTADQLRAAIGSQPVGSTVTVGYVRGGAAGQASITTVASSDNPPRPLIGVETGTTSVSNVKVTIRLQDVGGPSAGLMFALGIIDKLSKESLTGGKNIAGTGTIDGAGAVGPIGGISEKMRGARKVGATVFLVPTDNCAEARKNTPGGLELVRVSSLKSALESLGLVRAGKTPESCG